jgi:hypothetical protein
LGLWREQETLQDSMGAIGIWARDDMACIQVVGATATLELPLR